MVQQERQARAVTEQREALLVTQLENCVAVLRAKDSGLQRLEEELRQREVACRDNARLLKRQDSQISMLQQLLLEFSPAVVREVRPTSG